jgi:hypothetical protein
MFNNKKEFAYALLEGRTFLSTGNYILSYSKEGCPSSPFNVTTLPNRFVMDMGSSWDEYDKVVEFTTEEELQEILNLRKKQNEN